MTVAAAIREMLDRGLTIDQALMAAEAMELATAKPPKTARQERNARYYQAKKERLKASENVLFSPPLDKEKSPTPPKETNLPLLGVSDETLVAEASATRDRRKQNVDLFQTVVGLWNEAASAFKLVEVRDITPKRQSAILARTDDLVKTYDFPDPIAGWRKLIGMVRGSPFLRGELNGFRCDFDFVTRASSFTKVMEGKYEARPSTAYRR